MPVVLIGTLDTKGMELAFARDLIRVAGLRTIVIDAGSSGSPVLEPDVGREEVFQRAGVSLADIQGRGDRGYAVAKAAEGAAAIVGTLASQGQVEAILAIGGSAGTTIGTAAMRILPFGIPKVMVGTLASGQTRPYVGGSDLIMFPSVADIAGLNRLTRTVLTNAASALVGMVLARRTNDSSRDSIERKTDRPIVAATMFGVTTPCVDRARRVLEEAGTGAGTGAGIEVIVFHATGVGGQAMEALIRDGQVTGVLDLTTTELADELVGGALSAGPDRLTAAVTKGIPQVVSVGALDMVNFGPAATVPERFAHRLFHVHNPNVTLMRTTSEENVALGKEIARKLSPTTAPVIVLLPRMGVSSLDAPGKPFFDPEADLALFHAISKELEGHPLVRVIIKENHINDNAFAEFAARSLLELLRHGAPVLHKAN